MHLTANLLTDHTSNAITSATALIFAPEILGVTRVLYFIMVYKKKKLKEVTDPGFSISGRTSVSFQK
jgi:hypothetical protein